MSDAILIIPIVMFANRVSINTLIWQPLPKIMIIVSGSSHTYDDTTKTQSSETLKQLKHLMMCDYPLIKLLDKSGAYPVQGRIDVVGNYASAVNNPCQFAMLNYTIFCMK